MVEFLVRKGAAQDHDVNGNTPLHCAALGGDPQVADYLYDDDWVEGVDEAVCPVSFSTFLKFWSTQYPKLKIRPPCYATCVLCVKYILCLPLFVLPMVPTLSYVM